MKKAIQVLWPSFLVAGVAEVVFFTVFDPVELRDGDRVSFGGLEAVAELREPAASAVSTPVVPSILITARSVEGSVPMIFAL